MSTQIDSDESAPDPVSARQGAENDSFSGSQDGERGWPFVDRRRRTTDRRQGDPDRAIARPAARRSHPAQGAHSLSAEGAPQFTMREREIIHLLLQGMSNKRMGQTLGIREDTVKKHLQHIFDKLGVRSRTLVMLDQVTQHIGRLDCATGGVSGSDRKRVG